jgi:hypothetical protein
MTTSKGRRRENGDTYADIMRISVIFEHKVKLHKVLRNRGFPSFSPTDSIPRRGSIIIVRTRMDARCRDAGSHGSYIIIQKMIL